MSAQPVRDVGPTRSIGRNIGALLSSQVVTWTLATVLVWVVPKYLGPDAFGLLALAQSIWGIAAVFASFGTTTMLIVEVAQNRTTARTLVRNVQRVRLVLFALACPFVGATLLFGPYGRSTAEVTAIVGIGTALALMSSAYESGLNGLQEMGHTARIQVTSKAILTIGTLVALALGGRLLVIAGIGVGAVAVTTALFNRAFRHEAGHLTDPSDVAGRALLGVSLPFLLAEATRVVYQQIDTVVISLLVDSEAVGFYGTADILFGSLLFVPVIVTTAMFPAIADLHKRAPEEVPALLRRAFNTLLLVAVPLGVGTIVIAPSFVDVLYGSEFSETAGVLAVFGVVVVLSSQTILLGRFALATGKVRFWSTIMVAVTILSVPLDYVLVPWADRRYDNAAVGGALAYVVTECILISVGLATFGRGVFTRTTAARLVRCGVGAAAMAGAAWPLRDRLFILPGATAAIVYIVVVFALRTLNEEERALVSKGFGVLRRRGRHPQIKPDKE